MGVSTGLCHELADLARLRLTDDEAALFARQLEPILEYLQTLQQVELPEDSAAHAAERGGALRDDRPAAPLSQEIVLAQAPAAMSGHVVVPKFKED